MTYYFAHPKNIYNTRKEQVLMDMIRSTTIFSNPSIENPNTPYNEQMYERCGMDYFLELVDGCDAVIAYPFEDGTIPAGVALEMQRALETSKRCYLINPMTFDIGDIYNLNMYTIRTVEETRRIISKLS